MVYIYIYYIIIYTVYSHRLVLEGVVGKGKFKCSEGVRAQQDFTLAFDDELKQELTITVNPSKCLTKPAPVSCVHM